MALHFHLQEVFTEKSTNERIRRGIGLELSDDQRVKVVREHYKAAPENYAEDVQVGSRAPHAITHALSTASLTAALGLTLRSPRACALLPSAEWTHQDRGGSAVGSP
jgi:hypothetical protein